MDASCWLSWRHMISCRWDAQADSLFIYKCITIYYIDVNAYKGKEIYTYTQMYRDNDYLHA